MDLSDRAEEAEKNQDWAKAVRYYEAIAKAVPDRAVAFSRQCRAYAEMKETSRAIDACRKATTLPGVKLEDFLRLASLLMDRTPDGVAVPAADVSDRGVRGAPAHGKCRGRHSGVRRVPPCRWNCGTRSV